MTIFPIDHSPAPWRRGNHPSNIVDDKGHYVARALDMRNQNLILAAPELLDFVLTTTNRLGELLEQLERQGHPAASVVEGLIAIGYNAAVRATFGDRAVAAAESAAAKGGAA